MPFRDQLRARLFKLIKRVVYLANGGQLEPGVFPTLMPFVAEDAGQQVPILLQLDHPFVIDECLTLFVDEPAFQYFNPQDLEQALKALVAQAARQSKQLTRNKDIYDLIDGFHARFARGTQEYELAFVLNGLRLNREELAVGAAMLRTWSREQAIEWGVK